LVGLDVNTTESETGVPVVELRGELDLHTCPQLRTTLLDLMNANKRHVVLNMAGVPYLDSAALGVLVDAVRRARDMGGALHLTNVQPFVRRAFEITRLVKIFQMHNSVDDALAVVPAETGAPPGDAGGSKAGDGASSPISL
jgi:anti-sigma B factor antagonist